MIDSSLKVFGRWPSKRAQAWVECLLHSVQTASTSICSIIIIGSVARSAATKYSDVDILIVYKIMRPLVKAKPLSLDVKMYEKSNVSEMISSGHDLLGWAVQFGKVLFDDGFWESICRQWAGQVPLPSDTSALNRAHRASNLGLRLSDARDRAAARQQAITMLTQVSRYCLIRSHIYPDCRSQLSRQLLKIGKRRLSSLLIKLLRRNNEFRMEKFNWDANSYV